MSLSNEAVFVLAIDHLYGGGAERVVLDLLNNWPQDSCKAVLLVSRFEGHYCEQLNQNVEVLEVGVPSSPRYTIPYLKKVKELLVKYSVAAIYSHMTAINLMLLRGKLLGLIHNPIFVVEHNNFTDNIDNSRSPLRVAFARLETMFLYRFLASGVVGVSEGVTKRLHDYLRLPIEKVHTVYNPLDSEKIRQKAIEPPKDDFSNDFLELSKRGNVIVSVGRLHHQKGHDLLLRAFSMLTAETNTVLVILGTGGLLANLQLLTQELGISDRVFFPGFVTNPWWYLSNSDIAVFASRWEGLNLALLEALVCGTRVISTDCEFGPREIVQQLGGEVLLIPNEDTKAMAVKIEETLSESPHRSGVEFSRLKPVNVCWNYIGLQEQFLRGQA